MKISVIMPTRNPRPAFLKRVLDALANQSMSGSDWEFVVVDNKSQPGVSMSPELKRLPGARIVVEEKLGLTPARLRGFREASGDLFVLVDDDNVLAADYLEVAARTMVAWPNIGAMGAFIEAEYHGAVEPWLREFLFILCDMQNQPERKIEFQYAYTRLAGPWVPVGAGMVIRRQVVDAYIRSMENDPFRAGLDRTGDNLVGSGDADIAYTAVDLGLAIASTTRLRITHLIPPERLEFHYVRRLLYASNYGTARLLVHRGWKACAMPPAETLVGRAKKLVRHFVPRDRVDECWRAFQKGYYDGLAGVPYDPTYA